MKKNFLKENTDNINNKDITLSPYDFLDENIESKLSGEQNFKIISSNTGKDKNTAYQKCFEALNKLLKEKRIKSLDLSDIKIKYKHTEILFNTKSKNNTGLSHLSLTFVEDGSPITNFQEFLKNNGIEKLELNFDAKEIATSLRDKYFENIKKGDTPEKKSFFLDVYSFFFGSLSTKNKSEELEPEENLLKIIQVLRENDNIRELTLSCSTQAYVMSQNLAEAINGLLLQNNSVSKLMLDGFDIDDTTFEGVFKDIIGKKLDCFAITNNFSYLPIELKKLAEFIKNNSIKTLILDNSLIKDGINFLLLLQSLENTTIENLFLTKANYDWCLIEGGINVDSLSFDDLFKTVVNLKSQDTLNLLNLSIDFDRELSEKEKNIYDKLQRCLKSTTFVRKTELDKCQTDIKISYRP